MQMTQEQAPRLAPEAPGRLGYAIPAEALLPYLASLDTWRAERRQELDRIDAAALTSPDSASYTNDITLAMAIWQSVDDRWQRLTTLWDSSRADDQAREEMSRVIWGSGSVVGTSAGAMGLSLVEATRLSDALTTSLRSRLAFDPIAADVAQRLAAVRAGVQRCSAILSQQNAVTPPAGPDIDALKRRLDSLAKTAADGGDVIGPLKFLEADAAVAERDLIVSSATHRALGKDFRLTVVRRAELSAEEDRIRELAARCAAAVTPIPRLAVPDVETLGKVPQTRAELDVYSAKLNQVARALAVVRAAYAKPLAEQAAIQSQFAEFTTAAASLRDGPYGAVLAAAQERATAVLGERPCRLPIATGLVDACRLLLTAAQQDGSVPPGSAQPGSVQPGSAQSPGSQG